MTTTYFQIPDDGETMAKLVESVPEGWSCVDGTLTAPMRAIVDGVALAGTGIVMSRYDGNHASVIGKPNRDGPRLRPDLAAFFIGGMQPGFVTFDEAGFDRNAFALGQAKRIAAGFLRKGYRGWLGFYDGFHRDVKHDNAAYCDLQLGEWKGAPFMAEESGRQPPRLKLVVTPRYGGKDADVAPIVAACAALGLRTYEPRRGDDASVR